MRRALGVVLALGGCGLSGQGVALGYQARYPGCEPRGASGSVTLDEHHRVHAVATGDGEVVCADGSRLALDVQPPARVEIVVAPRIHAGEAYYAYTRIYDAHEHILASDDAFHWSAEHATISPGTCRPGERDGCVADSTAATFEPSPPSAAITVSYRGVAATLRFPVAPAPAVAAPPDLDTVLANARATHAWTAALPVMERALADADLDNAERAVRAFADAQVLSPALVAVATAPATAARAQVQNAAIATLGKLPGGAATLIEILSRPREGDRDLYLGVAGSAINGLGDARDPASIEALLVEMYRAPELLDQIQRTLVAIGPAALPIARKAMRGELPAVEALHPDRWCDASGACKPTGTRAFYAAEVIGQQPDSSSVPDLLAMLAQPPEVAWYRDGVPSKGPQLVAIIHALREIAAPEAAAPMRALWKSANLELRERAIDDYAYVARDAEAIPELKAIVGDARAPDELRQRAALALGLLARDATDFAPLGRWATQLEQQAVASKRATVAARAMAAIAGGVAVGARCRDDVSCYAAQLRRSTADLVADAKSLVDASAWTARERDWLAGAGVVRALVELGKRRAVDELPHVLDVVAKWPSEYVKVALWVTVQLAPRPCAACVTAIDAALATAPDALKRQLEIARNLYR